LRLKKKNKKIIVKYLNSELKCRQMKIEKREEKNRISYKIKRYSKKIIFFI